MTGGVDVADDELLYEGTEANGKFKDNERARERSSSDCFRGSERNNEGGNDAGNAEKDGVNDDVVVDGWRVLFKSNAFRLARVMGDSGSNCWGRVG